MQSDIPSRTRLGPCLVQDRRTIYDFLMYKCLTDGHSSLPTLHHDHTKRIPPTRDRCRRKLPIQFTYGGKTDKKHRCFEKKYFDNSKES